jgi:hypothetical protein
MVGEPMSVLLRFVPLMTVTTFGINPPHRVAPARAIPDLACVTQWSDPLMAGIYAALDFVALRKLSI